LQIAGPEADDWLNVPAGLVDTGADATIIPERLLSQILAAEWDQARLRSHWGEYRFVHRYEIDIRIGGRTFASVLVVADDLGDDIILGRDLLNQLRFLYDGPARQFILIE
jgi:predicted aspartyl protease